MEKFWDELCSTKDIYTAKEILYTQIKPSNAIESAINFAIEKHEGQTRKSGEPYAIHPILVSATVAYFGGDEAMVIAGLLHDVIEDTCCESDEVKRLFGEEVTTLVEGLTKIMEIREDQLIPSTSNEKIITSALTFRKMLLVSIKDIRVLVIKLCDRLHNMLTLDALPTHKQKRISEETLVVYAPIAHRLGISSIKNVLEDLSFKYLFEKEYEKINNFITENKQQLLLKLNNFTSKVNDLLLTNGFGEDDFNITKRVKHYYSIYIKMQRKGISIEEVLDLLAIRIVVKKPNDCYKALGILHMNFNPLIARFKDYIAIPKQNGYQTIHTTLFDRKTIIETQIRTEDMHRTAEYGVAAHWKYKSSAGLNPKLDWINEITSQKEEELDNGIEELYEYAKGNLYSEDIAVYSPKGDIFTLPRGATALDYAYEVHSEIGTHAKEVYINRQKVPLLSELKNGDIVRIITSKEPHFRCSWINSVKTGKAKALIKANCKQKIRDINHKVAVNILFSIFSIREEKLQRWLESENLTKKVFKIATDSVYLQDVVNALKKYPRQDKMLFPLIKFDRQKIVKQKFENIVVYSNYKVSEVEFDYCCHPKRGDDIIGFRKNHKVAVHHKLCDRAMKQMENKEEMIFVKWTRNAPHRYKMIISIENKKGSLASFLAYLAKININLITISLDTSEEIQADFFEMLVELPENTDLEKIKESLSIRCKLIEFVSVNDAYC